MVATCFFIQAMMSKPSAAMVPLMAGALHLWLLQRPWPELVRPLGVWAALAIPIMLVAWRVQEASTVAPTPVLHRPAIVGFSIGFYLLKIVWPFSLAPDYGWRPAVVLEQNWVHAAWILLLLGGAVLWRQRSRWPWIWAAVCLSIAGLLPVLGFVRFDYQYVSTVADHYLYLPLIGIALLIASAMQRWSSWQLTVVMLAIVAALGARSFHQTRHWRDTRALFSHTVRVNLDSFIGYVSLGNCFAREGNPREAVEYYRMALRIRPDYAMAHRNLAQAAQQMGDVDGHERHLQEAQRLERRYAKSNDQEPVDRLTGER